MIVYRTRICEIWRDFRFPCVYYFVTIHGR